jgi:hypothetical protein
VRRQRLEGRHRQLHRVVPMSRVHGMCGLATADARRRRVVAVVDGRDDGRVREDRGVAALWRRGRLTMWLVLHLDGGFSAAGATAVADLLVNLHPLAVVVL